MTQFDVFNGDADGICALQQLRLAEPCDAVLITGAKRDIDLLRRVQARPGDAVTVCDVSLDTNLAALKRLLECGVQVQYFDHHAATQLPQHAGLRAVIDTSPEVCTSALVDAHLNGAHRAWAVVAAFGDGMPALARRLAATLGYDAAALTCLREMGELINYNAYGDDVSDLFFHPEALYRTIAPFADPLRFAEDEAKLLARLRAGRSEDAQHESELKPRFDDASGSVFVLPDAPWARRLRGDLAHRLAQREPAKAHALASPNAQGGYTVSVRAPLVRPTGADVFCKQFPGGGGRAAAAGINHLPVRQFEEFAHRFLAENWRILGEA